MPDLTESFGGKSKPIELNKRQKNEKLHLDDEGSKLVEQLTDRIKHDKDALADLKEMAHCFK